MTFFDHQARRLHYLAQQGFEDGYQSDWNPEDLKGKEYQTYKLAWKRGRAKDLTGSAANTELVLVPIQRGDGKYHVQCGKDTAKSSGKYTERYVCESQIEARRYYDCINTFGGYKKRLIGPDGVLEERYISSIYG